MRLVVFTVILGAPRSVFFTHYSPLRLWWARHANFLAAELRVLGPHGAIRTHDCRNVKPVPLAVWRHGVGGPYDPIEPEVDPVSICEEIFVRAYLSG